MTESTRLTLLEGDADSMEAKLSVGLDNVHTKLGDVKKGLKDVDKKQDKLIRLAFGALLTLVVGVALVTLQLAAAQ